MFSALTCCNLHNRLLNCAHHATYIKRILCYPHSLQHKLKIPLLSPPQFPEYTSMAQLKRRKKTFSFIVLLLVGTLMIGFSIDKWMNDVNIDLSGARQYSGPVEYTGVVPIRRFATSGEGYKPSFLVKLRDHEDIYAVYRSYEDYSDLMSAIRSGDTVTVYYGSSSDTYNFRLFQIEKNGKMVKGYDEYNEYVSTYCSIMLFLGVLITTISIFWFRNITLVSLLNRLVGIRSRG